MLSNNENVGRMPAGRSVGEDAAEPAKRFRPTASEERYETTQIPDHQRTRCEVWTRVMGYHRPVSQFNPGKQSEHGERRYYSQPGKVPGSRALRGNPSGDAPRRGI